MSAAFIKATLLWVGSCPQQEQGGIEVTVTRQPCTPSEPSGERAGGAWREKKPFLVTARSVDVTMRAAELLAKGKQVWMVFKR